MRYPIRLFCFVPTVSIDALSATLTEKYVNVIIFPLSNTHSFLRGHWNYSHEQFEHLRWAITNYLAFFCIWACNGNRFYSWELINKTQLYPYMLKRSSMILIFAVTTFLKLKIHYHQKTMTRIFLRACFAVPFHFEIIVCYILFVVSVKDARGEPIFPRKEVCHI